MAAIAWTNPTGYTQSATATCGTSDTFNSGASDGALLTGAASVTVNMEADNAQTITTAGKLLAYLKDPITSRWARCPELDLTGTATGARGHAWPGFVIAAAQGVRLGYAPSGVAVSSGSITINIIVTDPMLRNV